MTGHKDGSMRLYSLKDGKVLDNIKNLYESTISCVKISSNNNYIVSSSVDGVFLKVYDLRMRKVLMSLADDSYLNTHQFSKVII